MVEDKKGKNFSLKKMMGTVGTVLKSARLSIVSGVRKLSWMKNNLPETDEAMKRKMAKENLTLSVGLPPAEVLVGKALAYGTLDPGFESITSVIVSDKERAVSKYDLATETSPKDLGFRWNNFLSGSGSSSSGGLKAPAQGLRAPMERPVERSGDRASQDGHSTQFPNTSPLTREEMGNIVPFRNYTFYSDLDVDKFDGYKGNFMLSSVSDSWGGVSSDLDNSSDSDILHT